ncbi:Non-ribosomal peptide synthetase [Pyrenophora teres f. teres]|uniref:Non-ribosomal peptide synthetase n=1 Tax=Pyrenophora teres f. teres TaxID=97479 RepID=A0A6S6W1V1_9PLEO|nr:Non-ribosomal peptide synthetase [Pyrenophora teres f. teres]
MKSVAKVDRAPERYSSDREHEEKTMNPPRKNELEPQEMGQIWAWNHKIPGVTNKCIHDLFAEQVLAQPNAPAICAWDGEMSYSVLDGLSTKLAGYLVKIGVKPGDVVPLCFEKSMWTVVAMLAVLKAGGAFAPLDPDHPVSRHKEILRQTGARMVVVSAQHSARWASSSCHVVTLSEASIGQLTVEDDLPGFSATPGNAAYVLFTSGSTGIPKGVVLEHRAVSTSCLGHGRAFGITDQSRVLQFTSYTFDFCMAEIITTLLYGGCICVPSDRDRHSDLAKAINTMGANWALLTPSVAQLLNPSDVPTLKILVIGGEQVTSKDWNRWPTSVQLINGYGPTECCIVCTGYTTTQAFKTGTIGTAIASVSWVVDPEDYHKLAPLGSVGELLVEGPILARGYLNDAEKTAAAFIEDPAWLVDGCQGYAGRRGRLYKTGDLVRYDDEGNLVCLGRKDSQVKVRGQRVELGEIEHHIQGCMPEANQIAVEVILLEGEKSNTILAAFLQLDVKTGRAFPTNKAAETGSLAQVIFPVEAGKKLAERLPSYMVPDVYFVVTQLPITVSGKTDRKRLREIGASFSAQQLAEIRTSGQGLKRQPSTENEKALQQLWAGVLAIDADSIGLDDSFFRLGGDSIAAMKLVGEARRAGIHLTVADLFRNPKLEAVASLNLSLGNSSPENIVAFALLGETSDVTQIREEVAASCNTNTSLIEDIYPCSPLQEGMMALASKRPGDYIMQSVLALHDDTDEDRFRAAWERVVQSTAVLRTRIVHSSKMGMLQVVLADGIEWEQANELEQYLEKDKSVSMGLGDSLARYALVRDVGTGKRWMVWTLHHALYDGWSLPQIANLVTEVYHGAEVGKQPGFNAFIKYLGEQDHEAAAAYWQGTLADCQAISFPALPPAVQQPVADATTAFQCPALARRPSDITMSTLIRAAWALLASSYTSSDDVVFGATVTGRNAPVAGIEAMAGPTIATVPVRVRVQHSHKVSEFLHSVQQQATEMIPYEQTGLHETAKVSADARHACSFQTLLIVQPGSNGDIAHDALGEWRSHSDLQDFTTYALMVQCVLADDEVQIIASFDRRAIEPWQVDKMLRQFSFVMQQLATADAEAGIASIDTLTPEDRQQLWEWNHDVPPAIERCIHDLFADQAKARPDAPAICAWDGDMTYGELDVLSGRLAGHLVELGVGPEDIVPLCFEKSMWTVVAMLAVLKAGGAFLLLDPSLPHERLRLMCRKVSAKLSLASEASAPLAKDLVGTVVIVNADSALQLAHHASPITSVRPTHTAYVIFTSGSTGEPKGCRIEHRAASSAVTAHGRYLGMQASTRTLQFASYAFAGSLVELLMNLCHGGCICVLSEEERRTDLASAMCRMKVNWAFLTSTVVDLLTPKSVPSLSILCVGGEPIRASQIVRWGSQVHLRQTYGSSEVSGIVSSAALTTCSTTRDVGRASTGVFWIVDPNNHNRLAPVGAVGEVLVEGPVLGREYIDEPDKTASTFIEAPAWRASLGLSAGQQRLYKTGDLARYKDDGSIELIGRKDNQVKLRGQRIEVEEIEHQARLAEADVAEIAVELIQPKDGEDGMLACFIVVEDSASNEDELSGKRTRLDTRTQRTIGKIQDRLERFLPQYMVPAVFIPILTLPVTWSKKIDRKRLREVGSTFSGRELAELQATTQGLKRQPSTENEKALQQLWAGVLAIDADSIGLDDSFFRLGGDSIAAMKLVGEARRAGIHLTVADLFRNPKLEAVASLNLSLGNSSPENIVAFALLGETSDVTQIREEVAASCNTNTSLIEDIYPCSPLQEGMMALASKRPGDYIMQSVLALHDDTDEDRFRAAWERVVQSTAVLRTRIVHSSKMGMLQVVLADGIEWEQANELEQYLEKDKSVSMGLGDSLARYALVRDVGTGKRWMVWTLHHALYDGWSLPQIANLVTEVYHGAEVGKQPGFNAFIKYLGEQDHEAAAAYWQGTLADCQAISFPALPPAVQQPVADATTAFQCPALARRPSDITMSTLIRAAWALLASSYTSSDDVVFGATVTGRNAPVAGIEAMAGPTIATVPVRVRVQHSHKVSEFLHSVQQQATEMIPYEQTGLHETAKVSADARHACSFQTLLIVQPGSNGDIAHDALGEWRSHSDLQDFTTYALMVQCVLADDEVQIIASFDRRAIEPWQVDKMLRQFSFVMQQLATADAEAGIASIDTLTPEDRQQLWEWNHDVPPAIERCIHDLFADQAKARPDAPAICAWDGDMTYGELDVLSGRLAGHLVELGVGPEDIVPLCFEKSMWTVVAMLAVLKAGGAFLLLDPSLPHERLRLMCRKVSAKLSLASEASAPLAKDLVGTVVIVNADSALQLAHHASPITSVRPTHTAYVIFTSGSTGEPKGCRIEHRAASSAVTAHGRYLGMQASTRTLQFASYAFAGSLVELLMNLCHGGCICVLSEEERRTDLASAMCRMKVNWAFLTSTVVDLLTPKSVPSLSILCVGGEPIRASQIVRWGSQVHLRQTYGSSEVSGIVSSAALTTCSTMRDVGRASTGVFWIVDPNNHNRLAPVGAVGEVLVEGPVLGREYIDEPDKTASTFIEAPAWRASLGLSAGQQRLYKTGDLARYKDDGSIELIGRKDNQVKLRGQRIEVEEIEHQARLAEADVAEIAVELIQPKDGEDGMLACFIVVEDSASNEDELSGKRTRLDTRTQRTIGKIQDRLERFLPQYMVPAVFIPILTLPVTWSKKIDRKRLREVGSTFSGRELAELQATTQGLKRQPSTENEKALQQLWAGVLAIDADSIGLDDSFFRLGGDSIAAMKLVGEARRAGIHLTVADLFRNPKLEAVASLNLSLGNSSPENIVAFALLGETSDVTQIREEVAASCNTNTSLIEDIYPCSPLQEGMMALASKRPGDYIMQSVLALHDDTDEDRFRAAWERVVQSTAVLRTRIVHSSKMGMLQVVLADGIEWEQANELEQYLEKDKSVSMGLGDSLARYALVRDVGTGKRWMVWTLHHALYDGWSLPQIANLVTEVYHGAEVGKQPGFNAFIKYLGEQDHEAAAAYWQGTLADCQAISFPALPPAVQQPVADATTAFQCPALARRPSDITMSTLIRAAWALLASSYTSSDDVVFGATVTGRNAPVAGIEAMAGPTIATVPVRVRVQHSHKVSEFLHSVQQQATEMIPYEQTGLHETAKVSADARHACSFQTLLIVQPGSNGDIAHDALGEWRSHSDLQDFTTYALMVQCVLADDEVQIIASFDRRAIEPWQVDKMLRQGRHRQHRHPHARGQAAALGVEPRRAPAIERCIHDLFADQAKARPDAPAICAWDGDMTYGELDVLSGRLAGHLVELGVGPEDIVPLCFEKSMWTVVAMLAVLKAGGAFLLLDPSLPHERLRLMCRKVSAKLSLASEASAPLAKDLVGTVVIVNADSALQLAHHASPITSVRPTHTAYVIFTSGSTGEPKGCRIEHRAASSAVTAHGRYLGMQASTRTLQFASYAFAGSLVELLMNLCHGGCICVLSEEERRTDLASAMCRMKVNWAFLTSTVVDLLTPKSVPSLSILCVGGEPIRASQIVRWGSQVHLRQTYGSSEVSGIVSSAALTTCSTMRDVGRASTGVFWIVDPNNHNRLAPVGAVGEVLVEGPVLGREYIDEPDKTASTFIEAPAWRASLGLSAGQQRLYKTGDLARYKDDGSIELIGRKDNQVKLRGQRIEVEEIEHQARLAEADVAEIAVELIQPKDGEDGMLACFIVVEDSASNEDELSGKRTRLDTRTQRTIGKIQDRLERFLPQYMVPAVFIPILTLPVTWSKKIDRKRLREVGSTFSGRELAELQATTQGLKRQPSTENEKALQQLWAGVLAIDADSIGLDDSFFRLGGDSIAAMKLVGEARRAGIHLTVADLFRNPKLEAVASLNLSLGNSSPENIVAFALLGETSDVTQIREEVAASCNTNTSLIEDIYPCSPLQEGMMALASKRPGDYIMQSVLALHDDTDEDRFRAAWERVVQSTAVLRTRIVHSSKMGMLQVVLADGIEWEQANELEQYLEKDKSVSMGLGDSLARYALVRDVGTGKRWMVWTLHHALYDGWSLPQIANLVTEVYHGAEVGKQPGFNAFIKYLGEQDHEAAAAYWQGTLADCQAISFPALPPAVQQPVADATTAFQCPALARRPSDITMSTLIRAAWALLASSYTSSDDVVFGATVTGRNAPVAGIEAMAGPTIATVPVRVRVQHSHKVSEFLHSVQQQATEMIPYEQTGLHETAKVSADARHACSFQTLLIVQPGSNGDIAHDALGEWRSHSDLQDFTTYALMVQCVLADDEVQIIASFDRRAIEPWQVDKMLRQFSFVMQQLATADAEAGIASIDTLTPEDRQQLWEWNHDVPPAIERCIHDLFADQAKARPDAPAICAWDGDMTYGELDVLSGRLAGHLVELGVGPEDIVPLCFEKSMWTVVAMLAVLKAGGAFLLLDPSLPHERLRLMCRKVSAKLSLASEASAPLAKDLVGTVVIVNADSALQLAHHASPITSVRPTHTAYVIFTSGSTGEPKGCRIEHRAASSAVTAHGRYLGMQASTRTLQFASYAFAGSLVELLMNLCHGGCICVLSEEERRTDLASAMCRMKVNWAFLTSTVVDLLTPKSVPSLSILCVGGEPIRASQIVRWGSQVHLRQTYGSSEVSGIVSSAALTTCSTMRDVGRASTGVFWIVDPNNHNRLAPVGAVGEVLVEGPVLGREYIDEPDKTASTFIEAPAWRASLGLSAGQQRLYKTGDLARYKDDGSIELIGRKDNQVKLRGQRIEVEEIEHQARLAEADVAEIAVELIQPKDGEDGMLACFIVVEDSASNEDELSGKRTRLDTRTQRTIGKIQDRLERFLPQYMVPAVFIPILTLPVTWSKKIDRKRLREVGSTFSGRELAELQATTQGLKRQPSTENEKALQQLWAGVLAIDADSIGLDDSFFRLGGDSIAAMKLVGEARRAGIHLTVADLFRNPKLEAVASLNLSLGNSSPENIVAFALLGETSDVTQIREEVAASCNTNTSLIEDIYPCSPLQEGMMALASKRPGDYIMQSVLALHDDTDEDRFRAAWERVVQSTAVLRTRIVHSSKMGMLQVVLADGIEWEQANELEQYLEKDKSVSMGLGDSLARYALVRDVGTGKRWMVWTLHHALYDGWSLPQIANLVTEVYHGAEVGKQPGFNAFIKYLGEQDHEAAAAYWQGTLADCQAISFPALPPAVQQPVADATTAFQCPALARRPSDITMSTLIRAAWALLASSYTSSDDVVFGATVTGRNAPVAGIEAMAGPTIATVPVRVRVQHSHKVSEFLHSVQQQATEMIPYEQTGLHETAKVSADARHACSFQTLLIVQPGSNGDIAHDALGEWRSHSDLQDFTTYALMVQCVLADDEVQIIASFDRRAIEPWQVDKMLRQFSFVMQQLATADAEAGIASIDTLTPEDRQQLWEWNHDVPPAIERCIHDLFADQAKARPDAPAICAWDGDMTYGELDVLSGRLAGHLVELGVGPEDIVPLCFEKSMWTVVAMLAVLKAGGAFLLLDPSLPHERLRLMCRKVSAKLSLASEASAPLAKDLVGTVVIVNADSALQLAHHASPITSVRPTHTAYVIFTSGSTGEPKGCRIEHRAASSAVTAHGRYLGMQASTRTLQFASYAFAGSLVELLMNLCHGGCICVLSEEERRTDLASAMCRMKVNWAFLTSTVVDLLTPKSVPSLSILCVGGEPIRASQIVRWGSQVHLRQTYGSSEVSGIVSSAALTTCSTMRDVGRASTGVFWIVDPNNHNRLAPVGAVGEVLVEGPVLGREYIDEPDKTASTFIEAPAWRASLGLSAGQQRLYKTGDLARYKDDGSIELIGRKDNQVKLRGQRIEVEEIEHQARLAEADVAEIAVELIQPKDGEDGMLACFIVVEDSASNEDELSGKRTRLDTRTQRTIGKIQDRLERFLPQYMVPAVFIPILTLPVTWSKKIDRKRLREVGSTFSGRELAELQATTQGLKRQPSTENEKALQQLWAGVLAIDADSIGLDDSFFRLGGDSIAAMKLVGEARRAGIHLTVADLFRNPKLDQLTAAAIASAHASPASIPQVEHAGPVAQSFAQGRLWFLEELHPGLTWYLMPLAVRIRGPLDLVALHSALLAVERRHETLRTTFATVDGASVQVVQPFQAKDLNIIDIVPGDEQGLTEAVHQDHSTPFDLRTEPGWRVTVYRMSNDDHVLSTVMHHIISDGWSVDVLMRELAAFYSASMRGQDPLSQVQPLSVQYRDFSAWQREQAQADEHQKQLSYWVEQLQSSRPAELLCDKPRPAALSGEAGVQSIEIAGPLYAKLQSFCQLHGVTQFVVLLAAFRATHFRLTGQEDATIGTPNANRDRWEVKDMVGFFVNMQCLRIKIGDESFEELVQQVHEVAVASHANADVPFENIVSKLKNDRDLSRHPLVQLVFAVHAQRDLGQLKLEGVETENLGDTVTSRFDLEFHFSQQADGLWGSVMFSTDLYAPETIDNMLSVFRRVLETCLEQPQAAVASMPLLRDADYAKLDAMGLVRVEKTAYPRDSSVVDLFREQAAACPSRVAVKDSVAEMTYAQLDAASDVLARWLARRSLAPETLVGVFASRSCEAIVAFLGILKANLAYLPFDVKTPATRMEDILLRVQATDSSCLAYVMFTSGSTGQPKGVMVEHRGIVRLVRDNNLVQHLPSSPVMAHMANLAFDASTHGTVALSELYCKLLALFTGLDMLCVGGEAVHLADLRAAEQYLTGKFVNGYGPTENTTFSTTFLVSKNEQYTNGVPIGRALSNSGAYVMDSGLRLVPLGVVGELVVTGDGLARGYTDPARNVDRFVSVEIGGKTVRAYRTGDYVRHRPTDGQLEFFGRMDGQVKIRGNRVELGEIEHTLRSDKVVREAVAVLQQHDGSEARLAGFVTVHEDAETADEHVDDSNESQHVDVWEEKFDADIYSPIDSVQAENIGRDFVGWTSMYDGSDIDTAEMNEWLDDTIATMLNGQRPGNVLEIGSGTGMILFNLGDGLQSYVGLDPSRKAVQFIAETAKSIPGLASKIRMYKATAADVGRLEQPVAASLVVVNSVVQYFPSLDYLFKMVQQLVELEGTRTLFFGDVRSCALHREFLATRAVHMAGDKATKADIRRMVADMERVERELLVDPAFFTALPSRLPGLVEHVEILPKKMKATNELSCYRYAAVVHVRPRDGQTQELAIRDVAHDRWIDFAERRLDRQSLLQQLKSLSSAPAVAVSNIPYSKTIVSRCLVHSLDGTEAETPDSPDWLASVHQRAQDCPSLSATELVELAQEVDCRVEISWSRQHSQQGGLDAIFHRYQPLTGERVMFRFPTDHAERPLHSLSSRPLRQQFLQKTQQRLLEMLEAQLPTYMVPQTLAILDAMPVNQNGKVDRKALEQQIDTQKGQSGLKRQPETETQRTMQQLWRACWPSTQTASASTTASSAWAATRLPR